MDKEQIKAEIERRMFEDYNGPDAEQNETAQGVCAGILAFIDSLPDEPSEIIGQLDVLPTSAKQSEDLDKAFERSKKGFSLDEKWKAVEYSETIVPTSIQYGETDDEYKLHTIIEAAFIAGAQCQKEQFEKNRLAACDAQTEEEYERETAFADEIIEKEHRTPTFSDAINYGMWLMKVQMGKQAREHLAKEELTLADLVAFDEGMKLGRELEGRDMKEKVIGIIEGRIAEILGDGQPAPILRYELQDIIKRIKED